MTYDQAQSPRLGQRVAPESPGLRLVLAAGMPEAPYLGQLVYVKDQGVLSVWDGVLWRAGSSGGGSAILVTSSTPTTTTIGALWFDPAERILRVYTTEGWLPVVDPGMEDTLTIATDAITQAAAANQIYVTNVQPWSNGSTGLSTHVNDLWITTAGVIRYWDGTTWTLIPVTATIGANSVGTAELAANAITSKHTLASPTINAAQMTGTTAVAQVGLQGVSTFIPMPEIRPTECYLTNLPLSTGGSAIFMGATGRLFIHTSARKYKKNIKPMDDVARDILQLTPVTYDFRKNVVDEAWETDGTGEIGFIADEADELGFEPLVGYGEDGQVETFHYDKLPIYQQVVLRAQQEEIDRLRADVELLKAFIRGEKTDPGD